MEILPWMIKIWVKNHFGVATWEIYNAHFFIVFDKEWKIVLGLHSVLATLHRRFTIRADLDLESGLKNGLECKKSTPLIGREARTRLFKFTS